MRGQDSASDVALGGVEGGRGELPQDLLWDLWTGGCLSRVHQRVRAKAGAPNASVFCSDPRAHYGHQNRESAPTYEDGTQSRDFTFVATVVEADLPACEVGGVDRMVFNVACGEGFTVLGLVETLSRVRTHRWQHDLAVSARGMQNTHLRTLGRPGKARSLSGYEPTYGFRTGLEEMASGRLTSDD